MSNTTMTGDRKLSSKNILLSVQHAFAMFGSTVLVPALTGLSPAVALFAAGIGTLLFHFITKRKVPAFLGSSFAFIAAIITVKEAHGGDIAYATGGIMIAGAVYLLLALIVKLVGVNKFRRLFPPVVTGPMIIIIGLMLAPTAISSITTPIVKPNGMTQIGVAAAQVDAPVYGRLPELNIEAALGSQAADGLYVRDGKGIEGAVTPDTEAFMAANAGAETIATSFIYTDETGAEITVAVTLTVSEGALALPATVAPPTQINTIAKGLNWLVAAMTIVIIVFVTLFAKGFFKLVPILFGIIGGYLISICFGMPNFAGVESASFFQVPEFFLPKFSWSAILAVAPLAIVTFVEHIGDITASSAVTGNDFLKDPGLHRTLIGDGVATMVAGAIGGPANTTYSENTGVLAATKNYNPFTLRVAAIIAILISFLGKLGGLLGAIPGPVLGGVSVVLFGMIAAVGLRTLVENHVDFSQSRNLLIVAVMLVLGLGGVVIQVTPLVSFSGTALAAVLGIVLNLILPASIDKPVNQ